MDGRLAQVEMYALVNILFLPINFTIIKKVEL